MATPTGMAFEANEKGGADTTIVRATVREGNDKKKNDTEEKSNRKSSSSSSSSIERGGDEGKSSGSGSGSGGHGYNADYSSSDSSSNNDATALPQKEYTDLNMNGCAVGVGSVSAQDGEADNDGCVGKKLADGSKRGGVNAIGSTGMNIAGSPPGERESCQSDVSSSERNFFDDAMWEDVIIQHPMDPRIDLSTVGFMGETSQLYSLQDDITIKNNNTKPNIDDCVSQNFPPTDNNNNQESTSLSFPCVEQEYTKLLESVRPFMLSILGEDLLNETQQNSITGNLSVNHQELAAAANDATESTFSQADGKDDDSSMVVLARSIEKHPKQPYEDAILNGSNLLESNSGTEERVIQQHPEVRKGRSLSLRNNLHQATEEVQQQQQQQLQDADHHESNPKIHNGNPQRYEIPMVSEYSSSARNGSSGASNHNIMSTSGSGSGGNTGSGSNQGGSSGSGNDQGGTSSNGNGSSGSGNEIGKGSSEELMGNKEERNNNENSRERNVIENLGTSVSKKANVKTNSIILSKHAAPNIGNTSHILPNHPDSLHHNHHHQGLTSQRRLSNKSNHSEDKNATREKKLQDKKRKRMNMRREYEDQMEHEMESSESSNGREVVIRPGKPTTLDRAVSFTKTAKLVINASPPFTVIYTNAAYSRLSGIDSHNVAGNPITTLLSLPSQQLSRIDFQKEPPSFENLKEKVNQTPNPKGTNNQDHDTTDSRYHLTAQVAGSARAAAFKDNKAEVGIEELVVASGYNKLNKVNIRYNTHQMLGRNVKVFKSKREEGSNESNITSSSDAPIEIVSCTMSISPIVASPEAYNATTIFPDKEKKGDHHHLHKAQDSHQHKSKRRKHHHQSQSISELTYNRKRQIISHYVIQLEPFDDGLIKHVNETKMETGNQKHAENEI